MTDPLVSVVIPLYNHAAYIERCLDSIVEDPYPAKEIVIIDDGSKDDSLDVVARWRESGRGEHLVDFRCYSRENRGITRTLNELVGLAAGPFIAFLASDDYLLPGGIGARVAYLQGHPEKMAVFADSVVVNDAGEVTAQSALAALFKTEVSRLASPKLLSYELVFHWCVPGPVFLARRELYDLVGGYDESIAVEDRDFYYRLAARDLLGFIDTAVAAYRVHAGGHAATPAREKSYVQAMLATTENNMAAFTGMRRAYLRADNWACRGKLQRLNGDNSVGALLKYRGGRLAGSILKRVYALCAPFL